MGITCCYYSTRITIDATDSTTFNDNNDNNDSKNDSNNENDMVTMLMRIIIQIIAAKHIETINKDDDSSRGISGFTIIFSRSNSYNAKYNNNIK